MWAALLACGLSATLLTPVRALGDDDFALSETSWNAASRFAQRAAAAGIQLETAARTDVDDLDQDTAILILHPTRRLPVESLGSFLRRGGRVLLADDFGSGDALFERYEIERARPRPGAGPDLRGRAPFPLAAPRVRHALTEGVEHVVTNHPASLSHEALEPLLAFGDGTALLLTGAVGRGRLVALADPSVFIDNMMAFPGNERLADNVLAYLVAGGADRVLYVSQDDVLEGRGALGGHPVAALGAWLADVSGASIPPLVLWVGAAMIAALLIALAATTLPRRSPYRAASMFTPNPGGGGLAGRIELYRQGGRANLGALLYFKAELETALLSRLGLSGRNRLGDVLAAARTRPGFGPAEEADLRDLLTTLDELRRREDLPPGPPRVAKSDFHAMVRRGREALARL